MSSNWMPSSNDTYKNHENPVKRDRTRDFVNDHYVDGSFVVFGMCVWWSNVLKVVDVIY